MAHELADPNPESGAVDRCGLPSASDRFQVLALDGGGAKALFTAHVLARLEADLGVRVTDAFDLIAGTSAGGIIALALGAGVRPAEIVEHYAGLTTRIFPYGWRSRLHYLSRPWKHAYSGAALHEALSEVLGSRLLGQSQKRLVIPSWDVQRSEVHLFKTPHHERLRRDWRIPMADVAMATTAAPSYFPAAVVDGQRLVDGGVWANNPSVVAIGEAVSMLGVPLSGVRVLNIGTVDQRNPHPKRFDVGGWATWATTATSLMLTASSRGVQGTASHLVGARNFARFDVTVPGSLFTLDQADAEALAGLAAGQSRVLSPIYCELFHGHQAGTYTPIHGPGLGAAYPQGDEK
ncbi:CBASS cGAMP-activated phospholipase [Mycolicibacterium sp. 050232]|uniref:CBASS cGAMP-activated phospholipase n=1 Tax=Mycolicibacterium sp. 050232 TaxID=3113982 RepID=UPI002E2B13AA|nr:CBASS cGAMP-activated phospholipase [Mycolicibacterium sp. 050232]MED5815579.1 CBASS cGAMP-activated phospholipase [Mycolicibacterium sp. 050232]